jgi:dynein heavy chain
MFICRGDAIDLDSFCGNIISECEKTEEILMNSWFPSITSVFTDKKMVIQHKGERLSRFYRCASSLVSIQLRSLLTRSILSYVDVFSDRRKLPRIEMELILEGNKVCFSPTIQEVSDMIVSVVFEVHFARDYVSSQQWRRSNLNNNLVAILNFTFFR